MYEDMIADKIYKRMRNGDMITNPKGSRKYEDVKKGKTTGGAASAKESDGSANSTDGKWVTINGKHVLIKN